MNFIKLTLANAEKAYINFDNIEAYYTITEPSFHIGNKFAGYTCLIPVGKKEADSYVVTELPEEIDNLLYIKEYGNG